MTSSAEWQAAWSATGLAGWDDELPVYDQGDSVATRKAIQKALDATYDNIPGLVSGSADLSGSNGTVLDRATPLLVQRSRRAATSTSASVSTRWPHRWSAWPSTAASCPIGGTFFVFSDYMKPSIRLAALSKAKVCFVFTHDSVGVGEDGPTHQPIEQLAALRAIPDLHVIRPGRRQRNDPRVGRHRAPRRAVGTDPEPPEHRGDDRRVGRRTRSGRRGRCRGSRRRADRHRQRGRRVRQRRRETG